MLFLPGIISHVEHVWDDPGMASFLERLCSFSRVILMDRRGSGLSDPLDGSLPLEEEVDDVIAVMDAAGSECAVLLGYLTGGPLAIKVAAGRPERVRALVLYAAVARSLAAPGYDWASDAQERSAAFDRMIERWGTGAMLDEIAPSRANDVRLRSWLARMERLSWSPGELRRAARSPTDFDVRDELGELRVPTLILHRMGDRLVAVRHSRYMAERIPGARYVELDGVDNLPSGGDTSALIGGIQEFLTGGPRRLGERRSLPTPFRGIVGSDRRDRGVPPRWRAGAGGAGAPHDPVQRHRRLDRARRPPRRRRLARPARRPRRGRAPRARPLRGPRGEDDRRRVPRRV